MALEERNRSLEAQARGLEEELQQAATYCEAQAERIRQLEEAVAQRTSECETYKKLLDWNLKKLDKHVRFCEGLGLLGAQSTWEIGEVLGEGSFGVVRAGRGAGDLQVAVKCADHQEVAFMKMFVGQHNVLQLYDAVLAHNSQMYLVMERGVELEHLLLYSPSEVETRRTFAGISDGVLSLHRLLVAHLDLKSTNIIMTPSSSDAAIMIPKVADFGTCVMFKEGERRSGDFGTPGCQSPQMHRKERWVPSSCDMWGLGCVLYQISSLGSYPYGVGDDDSMTLGERVSTGSFKDPDFLGSLAVDERRLVLWLLSDEEAARPSAEELVADEWVAAGRRLPLQASRGQKSAEAFLWPSDEPSGSLELHQDEAEEEASKAPQDPDEATWFSLGWDALDWWATNLGCKTVR